MSVKPATTEDVAENHYLQVTDDHFRRAANRETGWAEKAAQNPAQQPSESARRIGKDR